SFFNALAGWGPFRVIAESIRNKLLLTLSLLALIPLGALGIVAYRTAANALEHNAIEHYAAVATSRADSLSNAVRGKEARLTEFASKQKSLVDGLKQLRNDPSDKEAILAEMTIRLNELKTMSPHFETVSVLDDKGQVLAQTEEFKGTFANRDKSKDL